MSSKEYVELNYEIMVDDENGDRIHSVKLNGEEYKYVDPACIKVGTFVWMDKDLNKESGLVTEIRSGKNGMIYYDVGEPDTLRVSEVAMFRVHKAMLEA